ncbi:MAG: GerW family sporulation protein [Bacillota bacterium]
MHPIENIMQTAMAKIKEMVDVNTIIGDPVVSADGSTIIPISKVSFGFISGGGEYGGSEGSSSQNGSEGKYPFAGGAGSGICVTPVGFLVVDECNVQLLPVSGPTLVEQAVEAIPQLIAEIKDAVCGRKNEEGE